MRIKNSPGCAWGIFLRKFRKQDFCDLAAVKAYAGVVAVVIGKEEIILAFQNRGIAVAVAAVILD